MNLKTTLTPLVLLIVTVAGAGLWLGYHFTRAATPPSETLSILEQQLTPGRVSRVEVARGEHPLIVERGPGGEWDLPGKWPARQQEVNELVGLLTGLRSRFAPITVGTAAGDLAAYGLDKPVTVTVHAGDKDYHLHFGEKPDETNRFSRPTFLRLDDRPEVVRLAPGIVTALNRPLEYYQQHRLFSGERGKAEEDKEPTETLTAKSITVKGSAGEFTVVHDGDDWDLSKPVHDHTDPDKIKAILTAVPDIWAEQFVENPKKDLAEYGLKEPAQTLSVTKPSGETLTLLIGKGSQVKTRTVMRMMPGGPPGMPPTPHPQVITEEYRFAKLRDNDQIFEIKADKLKDVFVGVKTLRDVRLARFSPQDAQRVEISQGGKSIVLDKEKDRWHLREPLQADAESSKINELLDKLSGLEAKDENVVDQAEPKKYGLDQPSATIKVIVAEAKGEGDKKTTRPPKTLTFELGKDDVEKSKVYVRLGGWERVNAVNDDLLRLVERPALAYRGRRVLDFSTDDLAKIEVQHGNDKLVLEQAKTVWRLSAPVQAEADSFKAGQLAGDLGRLEAVQYVSNAPDKEELDKKYGLDKPTLTANVTFTKADKPAQTLLIGKQVPDKPEYYAKLASEPAVFVVRKDLYTTLEQGSLALRPLELWKAQENDVVGFRLQKEGQEFRLKRDGQSWQVAEPFEAKATEDAVKPIVKELAAPRAERYEAHSAKDAATYGLDKPYLRLVVQTESKKDQGAETKAPQDEPKKDEKKEEMVKAEHVLLIGKPTAEGAKNRYAKLGNSEAVFVLADKFITAVDHSSLDLLDRNVLSLDPKSVTRVQSNSKGKTFTLQRDGEAWKVEAPEAKFQAAPNAMAAYLAGWSYLQAERFVQYGGQVEPKQYGLDEPLDTITVSVTAPAGADKKSAPSEHTLVVGKEVEKGAAGHYARLDNGPGVFVLAPFRVTELTQGYLAFADPMVLKFDAAGVKSLQRTMGADALEIAKQDDGWHLTKPTELRADGPALEGLLEQLANLRGDRVAAYQAKDLKPFGLDAPAAVLTVRLAGVEGKTAQHVLKVGKVADGAGAANGDRYAQADDSPVVAVVAASLANKLLAPPLHFRDRLLARFTDADKAVLQRGPRKAAFAKIDGTWKLTSPLEADAEQTALEDFINALARLRADELVAEKPADLKLYGLDPPEARWQLELDGKEVLSLQIGGHDKVNEQGKEREGPRRYAKLANGDLVFLLDAKLTGQALAEYRSRTPWGPLDAVQIESLSYTRPGGDSFTLQKAGTTWEVPGKSDVKVKTEAVTETVDALARLKAERYVVDKDADLKLYGLEPPQLSVEIQTRNGKRVLQVGRAEGDSKRYYARVPDGNRSDVFVIAEADATPIVRSLPQFTQAPAKAAAATP